MYVYFVPNSAVLVGFLEDLKIAYSAPICFSRSFVPNSGFILCLLLDNAVIGIDI